MEVRLCAKEGTDISVIEQVFGEMSEAFPRPGENEDNLWAQEMISRTNFDRYAMSEEQKAERLRISSIYWGAQKEGEAVAQGKPPAEARAALNQLLEAANAKA